jgi:23S rRNA (adenine2030-N6)-methyltransferase
MANRHFARIGDVWKHLPLCELLSREPPNYYCESHAGAAIYPLTHSPDRDYGVYHLLGSASANHLLSTSRYRELLGSMPTEKGYPTIYPGSAYLAMLELGASANYLLCDLDDYSAETLHDAAAALDLDSRTEIVEGDGLDAVWEAAVDASHTDPESTLVHIDPFDPLERSARHGLSAVDLCGRLANQGIRVFYWYGFESPDEAGWMYEAASSRVDAAPLWFGEIALEADDQRLLLEGILLVWRTLRKYSGGHHSCIGRSRIGD